MALANISDTINLTSDTDDFLTEMYEKSFLTSEAKDKLVKKLLSDKKYYCPSDIFFAKTIPLKSVEICVDESSKEFKILGQRIKGLNVKYTVRIDEDYEKYVDEMIAFAESEKKSGRYTADKRYVRIIGQLSLINYFDNTDFKFDMLLIYGINAIAIHVTDEITKFICQNFKVPLDTIISDFLLTWYSLQVSMLNPDIRVLFSNPKTIKYSIKSKGGKDNSRKRKIGYHRIYTIKKDDLEEKIYGGDHKRNRKCLCWYVIGHWREYKDGHKTFVQGFWKGVLRDAKKNLDDGRERVVQE